MKLLLFIFVLLLSVQPYRKLLDYNYTDEHGKVHVQYISDYDTDMKRPYQVGFVYTCEMASRVVDLPSPERPGFRSDKRLPRKDQAMDSDYVDTPFSRGHLGTAKYFAFNNDSYFNTFYLTNVAPQYQLFNQVWFQKDENVVLQWANDTWGSKCIDNVVIDTTVIGKNGTIGKDDVVVPEFYVNSICEPHTGYSLCLWGQNVPDEIPSKIVYSTVDDCEKQFSFKFFEMDLFSPFSNCLSNKQRHVDYDFWNLNTNLEYLKRG